MGKPTLESIFEAKEQRTPLSDIFDDQPPATPKRTLAGTAGDVGVSALKGAVGLVQSGVGVADLVTGGRVGKALEDHTPLQLKKTQQELDTWHSDAQQAANQRVSDADGFVGTIKALAENPSVAAHGAIQSAPSMLGGIGAGRTAATLLPKTLGGAANAFKAAAVGEGLYGSGSAAETMREQSDDGLLSPRQRIAALGAGALTATIGRASGGLQKKLGWEDVEASLVNKAALDTAKRKALPTRMAQGAVSEGLFEEAGQSAGEQAAQNFGMGKPIGQGVSEAAGEGLVVGGLMGAGGGAYQHRAQGRSSALPSREEFNAEFERQRAGLSDAEVDAAYAKYVGNSPAASVSDVDLLQLEYKPVIQGGWDRGGRSAFSDTADETRAPGRGPLGRAVEGEVIQPIQLTDADMLSPEPATVDGQYSQVTGKALPAPMLKLPAPPALTNLTTGDPILVLPSPTAGMGATMGAAGPLLTGDMKTGPAAQSSGLEFRPGQQSMAPAKTGAATVATQAIDPITSIRQQIDELQQGGTVVTPEYISRLKQLNSALSEAIKTEKLTAMVAPGTPIGMKKVADQQPATAPQLLGSDGKPMPKPSRIAAPTKPVQADMQQAKGAVTPKAEVAPAHAATQRGMKRFKLSTTGGDVVHISAASKGEAQARLQLAEAMDNIPYLKQEVKAGESGKRDKAYLAQVRSELDEARATVTRLKKDGVTTPEDWQGDRGTYEDDMAGSGGKSESRYGWNSFSVGDKAKPEKVDRETFKRQLAETKAWGVFNSSALRETARNKAGINIWKNEAEMRQSVGDAAMSVSSENDGRVEGMYDPKTGQIHVFAESISDPVRAQYVLRHEMRHRGLRSIFGSQLNVQLEAVWRGNKKAILAYTDSLNVLRVGAGLKGLNPTESHADLLEATDEWLAQTDKTGGPIARLIAAARNLLRNMGLDLQWSDADILALAGKSLREGGKIAKGDDANRLSMGGVDNSTQKMDNVNTQGDHDAGGNVEVAPNPDDKELSDRWDKVEVGKQRVISRQIMDEFGPAVFTHHGLSERDYRITHVEGGFLGKTNPSSVVKFFTGTWEQRRAALIDLGHVLKQQSVVLFDANDQTNGPQGYFVAVTPEAQLTPDEVDDLYRAIHKQMPEAEGFSQIGNTLVIGNFTEYNDKLPTMGNDEFFSKLESVAGGLGDFWLSSSSYRSEYITMADAIKEEQDGDTGRGTQQRLVQEKSRQWRDDLQKAATKRLDGLLPRYSIGGAARVERADRAGGQGADERYSLPVGQDGRVRLVHYSYREGLSVLDPAKHGTGINGAESKRKRDYPEYWVDRTYFGVEGGNNDYRKEPGLGPHEYRAGIALDRLYNFNADPDGLLARSVDSWGQRNVSLYEKQIKEAGYEGYYTRNTQLGDVVAKFSPTQVGAGTDGAVAQGAAGAGVGAATAATAQGNTLPSQRAASGVGATGQDSVPAAPGVRFAIAPPASSQEFKAWAGGLPTVNPKRVPAVRRNDDQAAALAHLGPGVYPMVHITNHDFTTFDPKAGDDSADSRGDHPFFFTPSPKWAAEFKEVDALPAEVEAWIEANGRPTNDAGWLRMQDATGYGWHPTNVMPVYAKTERPFRYWDQGDIDALEQALRDNKEWARLPVDMREAIGKGDWMVIEQREVQDAIRSAGFDAFFLNETNVIKSRTNENTKFQVNLAVFKPENIKALRGNVGSYGQRPVTEAEAALLNMSAAAANAAQAQGDIRFSVSPRAGNDLPLDIATVSAYHPKLIEKHARAIGASYTGFKFKPFEKPLDTVNRLKKHMADNLVWLYHATPEKEREMTAKWYEGANRIAADMAKKYGYTTEQAAGVIAAMSPQQPWFNNLYLADRVMRYMSQSEGLEWRDGMAGRIPAKFSGVSGRALRDLVATDERAVWIRAYDESVGPGQVTAYRPDGTTGDSAGAGVWFIGNDMIAKAVNILDGKAIGDNLSLAHKVRNFYNNIIDPQDRHSVTIDTHAVAAAFLAPLGGTSREVLHNFGGMADGGKPGGAAGAIGTYYIVADAYRDAAARLGVLPREVQSVAWEQVRTMFPTGWKRSAAAKTIHQKWSDYAKGKKGATLESVRGYIAETTGIQPGAGGNAQTRGAADQGQLYRDELGAGRNGGRPGRGVSGGDTGGAGVAYSLAAARFGDLSEAQRAMLERVGGIVGPTTVRDRVERLKGSLMDGFVQKVADQFAPLKDLDYTAYLQARMTKGSTGALEALMMYGNLHIEDGVYDTKAGETPGLIKTMQRLQGEQDRFLWWMAANRAAELKTEDREQLFSDEDIATGKTLNQGSMPDGTSRETLYRSVLAEYRRINSNVLDIAMESGIIDNASRELWDKAFYVPFYRAMEDGSATPNISESRGLIGQYASKRLKGGKQKLNEDLMANVLMNWGHLLSASAKNRAAKTALSAAERAGVAHKSRSGAPGSVWYLGRYTKTIPRGQEYLDDGVTKVSDGTHQMEVFGKIHYTVDDPYIMEAISAIEYTGPSGPGSKLLGEFKRLLTYGVTLSPTFKLRNLIRDSIASIAVSPLGANPLSNVRTGVALMRDKENQAYASALASGGLIRFGSMLEGSSSSHLQRLINQGVDENTIVTKWEHVKDKVTAARDWYENIGDISEGANRMALYKQQLEAGKSHAEAAFAARDLLDFSMGGTHAVIRYLTTVVPFMNARIQGLYKLGRGAKGNPARFASVIGATALASIALMLAYRDDDDWKRREEWDRDNFWWFKIDGVAYRIPKPFEVGAIATVAERGLELMVSDEMDGARFADAMKRMVGNTLAFNPIPQAFKPVLDVYANKDSFTGRDIETMGMDRYLKSERIDRKTSEVARFLGSAGNVTNISPVQVDHMIKAYFGWLGTAVTTATDYGIRPLMGRPERPSMELKDVFFVGNFAASLPTGSSRYLTQLYDQSKEIEQAYATYAKMVKAGDPGATEFFESNRGKIAARPVAAQATRTLSSISQRIRAIEATPYMTPREKRVAINRLNEARNQLAETVAPRLNGKTDF